MSRIEQLQAIEEAVWSELARAPHQNDHGWHVGVLATTDGDAADARCVVLREADAARRSLVFYTDSRSPKTEQMLAHPSGTVVLWSAALSWQLRLRVQLSITTSGLAVSSRWARLKMSPGAQDYLSPLPPGSPVDQPLPERGSRAYFGLITARVISADWLELHAEGHRRAAFDAKGRRWLAP